MGKFLLAFALSYLWHGMGTTIGYHRLLSHRSFKCPKLIEYFWVAGGYLAYEGSPIWWVAMHRAHHKYVDTPLDPHSPRYGLINAYCGWLKRTEYPAHINPALQCPDLLNDALYRFLEQDGRLRRSHFVAATIGILFRVALWRLFGWKVALGSTLAGVTMLQVPLLLNVVCHIRRCGYRSYATDDDSVNVWWMALLAHGEGWHNNHHAFPGSARQGLKPYEFDASWLVISSMHRLGMASNIIEA